LGWLPPSIPTGCTEIESAVSAVVGRDVADLRSPRGTVSDEARMLMITLAVDYRADTSAALAQRYGLSDLRSVRRIARRGRARAADSIAFASLRQAVIAVLDAQPASVVPGDPGSGDHRGSRRPGLGELREAG
jgi:hypothetical protein